MLLFRFIFNFVLFGVLFFLIWHFFPETFSTLVSWAASIVDFFQHLFSGVFQKAVESTKDVREEIKTVMHFIVS